MAGGVGAAAAAAAEPQGKRKEEMDSLMFHICEHIYICIIYVHYIDIYTDSIRALVILLYSLPNVWCINISVVAPVAMREKVT